MKLVISNLAKVSNASLEFDGITIIAGANNTGKSTVGKALWAMFTAFSNLDTRIRQARCDKYEELLTEFDDRVCDGEAEYISGDVARDLVDGELDFDGLEVVLNGSVRGDAEDADVPLWMTRFEEVRDLGDEDLKRQEVLNTLARVFYSQCTSFIEKGSFPKLEMIIKKKSLSARITNDLPVCEFGVRLQHKAFYIDTPEALVDVKLASSRRNLYFAFRHRLSDSLVSSVSKQMIGSAEGRGGVVDDLLIRKKFSRIEGLLTELMGGFLRFTKAEGLVFVDRLFPDKPIKIENLSQGLKSMALLQAAFMNGTIGDEDVLILDEPEIHLHPVWQIRYAEFLVLLQKEFKLTVLLTSHSPDFVQAVRLYAQKHGASEHVNGYLSAVALNGSVTLEQVPHDNWDVIFETFGSSFDELMRLREELEARDEQHRVVQA